MRRIITIFILMVVFNSCDKQMQKNKLFAQITFSENKNLDDSYHLFIEQTFDLLELKPLLGEYHNKQYDSSLYRLTIISDNFNPYSIEFEMDDINKLGVLTRVREFNKEFKTLHVLKDEFSIEEIENYLNNARLWELNNTENNCDGSDGIIYLFECVKKESENVVLRWSPESCPFQYSKEFLELVSYLEKKSLTNSD